MKAQSKLIFAALALSGAVTANAEQLSYTYVEIDYTESLGSSNSNDAASRYGLDTMKADVDGVFLFGSLELTSGTHVIGGYANQGGDWNASYETPAHLLTDATGFPRLTEYAGDSEMDSLYMGLGVHGMVTEDVAWNIDLIHVRTHLKTETYSIIEDGVPREVNYTKEHDIDSGIVSIGTRYQATDALEVDAAIQASFIEWDASEPIYNLVVGATYSVSDHVGLRAGVNLTEDASHATIGLRYTF